MIRTEFVNPFNFNFKTRKCDIRTSPEFLLTSAIWMILEQEDDDKTRISTIVDYFEHESDWLYWEEAR